MRTPIGSPTPRDVGKPFAVLVLGLDHDALDVLHHGEAERVGVEPAVARIVEGGLHDDVGVRGEEFKKRTVADLPRLVQAVHDRVMAVGGTALVHQLGLALRIEILRDEPDDADDLALPGLQARRRLLQEVQDILLRQLEQGAALGVVVGAELGLLARHGAPQVVEHGFTMLAPLALAPLLRHQVGLALAGVAVDPVAHQAVRGVEEPLHRRVAVAFLAIGDVALGEIQVLEDAVGIGPLLEEIVVLEEVIVAERGMRDHQRLHRGGVFLHDVADAGIGIDDDLVGEAAHALAIVRLMGGELFAEGPMIVIKWHADRGISVQHLLGGDHLDLVGVGVEAQFPVRDRLAGIVDPLHHLVIPVGAGEEQIVSPRRGHAVPCLAPEALPPDVLPPEAAPTVLRSNNSRNTG